VSVVEILPHGILPHGESIARVHSVRMISIGSAVDDVSVSGYFIKSTADEPIYKSSDPCDPDRGLDDLYLLVTYSYVDTCPNTRSILVDEDMNYWFVSGFIVSVGDYIRVHNNKLGVVPSVEHVTRFIDDNIMNFQYNQHKP